MADDRDRKSRAGGDDLLDWFTISYRTLYIGGAALVVLLAFGGYYYYDKHSRGGPATEATPTPAAVGGARFRSLEGNIKVKAVGTFEWVTADKDLVLKRGDLVKTSSGSSAEITFFDGTVVQIRPESLITIEETSENPATKERRAGWHISSGEVTFTRPQAHADGTTEITTPLTRVSTKSEAEGAIGVKESGESDVRLFSGESVRVQMTKTGEEIVLGSQQALKVDSDGRSSGTLALPAVPTLINPPHQTEITYTDLARAITPLVWKSVPTAATYRLVVDFRPTFSKPLVDEKGIKETTRSLTHLDVGKYYWRVAAVDRDGNEGNFSDFSFFTIARPSAVSAAPPPLVIESFQMRANILQIKGRTEPGATVSVNRQPLDVEPNGSFNEFINIEKTGPQVVVIRAVGINGGVRKSSARSMWRIRQS